jgi:hypothetical protein
VSTVPPHGRVVDSLSAFQAGAPGQRLTFRQLDVALMSPDELLSTLRARNRYKKDLFAEAIAALEKDPTLADLEVCKTMEQIETGECLVDTVLVASVTATAAGRLAVPQAAPAPTTPPAAAPLPTTPPSTAPLPTTPPPAAPAPTTPSAAPPAQPERDAAVVPPPRPTVAKDPQGTDVAAVETLLSTRKVRAAALPQIQRKFAVLIGIDRYDDPRMPQLDNAVRDARAVASVLEATMGYETLVVENGSKQQMVATLNRLATIVNPSDSVIIYYAGHGELVPATGLGYWQPANADPKDPRTWISNADIGRMITALGASQVALISDSCYSGSLVPEERIRPSTGAVDPGAMLSRKAAVIMSSGGNEPVFDSGKDGHSPFAWSLMRTLQQVSSWQAGGNVFERVRFSVARELPQRPRYGGATTSGHQPGSDYLFEQRELDKAP